MRSVAGTFDKNKKGHRLVCLGSCGFGSNIIRFSMTIEKAQPLSFKPLEIGSPSGTDERILSTVRVRLCADAMIQPDS